MNMIEGVQDTTLDPSVLEGYFRDNRKAREDFVVFFRNNLNKSLSSLQSAVRKGDYKEIEYLAHRLRGSVGYIGAYKIAKIFQRMEELAPRAEQATMESLLDEITESQKELMQCI